MKQTQDIRINANKLVQITIFKWLKAKNYPLNPNLPLGYYIELLCDFTQNHHLEEIASGVFNHLVTNEESIIGWQGEQLIDILEYEVIQAIKKKHAKLT